VNTDGVATKSPINAAAGGIFRDKNGNCIGCFAQNLGNGNAFHSELLARYNNPIFNINLLILLVDNNNIIIIIISIGC